MKRLLLLSAACLAACSALRKDSANSSFAQNSSLQTEFTAMRKWTIRSADSSNSEVQWRIWPKGIVYYSPDSGFKGEVDMMELWKRDNRKSETTTTGVSGVMQKQSAQQTLKEKKAALSSMKIGFAWWYWVVGLVVLVGWLWWKLGRVVV